MVDTNIKRLQHEDTAQALSFLRRHYGEAYYGSDDRFFRWQYRDVPAQWFAAEAASGHLPANGVFDDQGNLLALHVFIPFDGIGNGAFFRGAFDEEWINGSGIPGLGRLLASRLIEEVDVYCGFGCNDLSERAFQTLGFEFVPEIPRLVAVIDSGRLHAAVAGAGYDVELEFVPDRDCKIGERSAYTELVCDDLSDHAIDDHNKTMSFGIRRTREWLRWRYEHHPYIKYSMVTSPNISREGAAVVRIERLAGSDQCVARIVDLIGERMQWPNLFVAALSFARANECMLVDFFSSSAVVINGIMTALYQGRDDLNINPRLPYMFQPLAFGVRNSINFAIHSKLATKNSLFSAVKGDGTQDILRHPNTGPQLQRRI